MSAFLPFAIPFQIRGIVIGTLIFLAFLLVLIATHRNDRVYPHDDAGLSQVHGDQCERPGDRARLVEAENTVSNVAYALAGALILARAGTWAGWVMGANLVLLSLASGWYHATLSETPQAFDVAFVYSALLSLSAYVSFVHVKAARPFDVGPVALVVGAAILAALLILMLLLFELKGLVAAVDLIAAAVAMFGLFWVAQKRLPAAVPYVAGGLFFALPLVGYAIKTGIGWKSEAVFAIVAAVLVMQIVALCASAPGPGERVRWGLVGTELGAVGLALGLGVFCQLGDGYAGNGGAHKIFCGPDSILQAHAVWHVLSAAALLLSYDVISQFLRGSDAAAPPTVLLPSTSALEPIR